MGTGRRRAAGVRGVAVGPAVALSALTAALGLATLGADAASARSSRYAIRVVNSGAGGGGRTFHVGSPINVTLVDRATRVSVPVRICLIPAPIDRPSCHGARTNRTLDSLAPSRAGLNTIRVVVRGRVLIRRIRVHAAPTR
jgi:hypothetical protein